MPFREKVAWLSLGSMAVAFVPYFAFVVLRGTNNGTDVRLLAYYALAVAVQLMLLGAGRLYLSRTAPDDARTPPDERDEAINRRSMSAAYYALIFGTILVGCIMPFYARGWSIVNSAILAIVIAEIVHYGVAVWSYRRQA